MEKYKVTLEYCAPCNYRQRAVQVADDMLSNYQHVIESFTFITGTKGIFDIKVNDQLIFSKHNLGRHAEPDEVLNLFRNLVGPEIPLYPQSK